LNSVSHQPLNLDWSTKYQKIYSPLVVDDSTTSRPAVMRVSASCLKHVSNNFKGTLSYQQIAKIVNKVNLSSLWRGKMLMWKSM
jgi:hypothetical protein